MPKILITGNGFDLRHNLPTKYIDFIKILKHLINNGNKDFNSVYSNTSDTTTFFETFEEEVQLKTKDIDLLIEMAKDNLWLKFFINDIKDITWIDLEEKIRVVVEIIFQNLHEIEQKVFENGIIKDPKNAGVIIKDSNLTSLLFELRFMLTLFNLATTYDSINQGVWVYKEFLTGASTSYYSRFDTNKISEHLLKDLEVLKIIFENYLKIFVVPLYENFKSSKMDIDDNLFSEIDTYYTFNYTQTFEKLYKSNTKTSYLHGNVNGETARIVLGVSDLPNKIGDTKELIPFTKSYQKIFNNTDYKFLIDLDSSSEKAPYFGSIFIFYGHSLDESDKNYVNEIFGYITYISNFKKNKISKENLNKFKIAIVHHDENSKKEILKNIFSIRGPENIERLMRKDLLSFIKEDEIQSILEMDIKIKSGVSI